MVVVLAFVGAALSVVAQSEAAPSDVKLVAAAIAAGSIAALALLKNPGQSSPPPPPPVPRLGLRQRLPDLPPDSLPGARPDANP